jgi:DNA polymerase
LKENYLMTAREKSVLARFLDTAGDYLRLGYALEWEEFPFSDDPPADKVSLPSEPLADNRTGNVSSLPLAYLVDEDDDSENDLTGDSLEAVADDIASCTACPLAATRTNTVPGEGINRPLTLIIGEGPGADEDRSGRPFVGKAGQLLDKMLSSIGLYRDKNCYIANVVKCRPPENRKPEPPEIEACAAFLDRQIHILKPLVILCAGATAAQRILKTDPSIGIGRLRGRFGEYEGIPVLPTYHPSALLRDENLKRPAWEDLKLLKSRLVSLDDEYAAMGKNVGEA